MRLDLALAQKYSWSRNKAQQHIRSGLVFLDGTVCIKPSLEVTEITKITLTEDRRIHWVSRSAEKLEGFFETMMPPLKLEGKKALDV
jgi:23S rRNA (cytidine1920-2'-O)/16S rRNA (cytidine1409-2'-O)-methyltransferase